MLSNRAMRDVDRYRHVVEYVTECKTRPTLEDVLRATSSKQILVRAIRPIRNRGVGLRR